MGQLPAPLTSRRSNQLLLMPPAASRFGSTPPSVVIPVPVSLGNLACPKKAARTVFCNAANYPPFATRLREETDGGQDCFTRGRFVRKFEGMGPITSNAGGMLSREGNAD
jgi:hypothetical protein